MVSLHKIVDSIKGGVLAINRELSSHVDGALAKIVVGVSSEAMCFYMGNRSDLEGIGIVAPLVRLPYDTCWFEGDSVSEDGPACRIGVLCSKLNIDETMVMLFQSNMVLQDGRRSWGLAEYAMFEGGLTGRASIPGINASHGEVEMRNRHKALSEAREWISVFLTALNCVNVRAEAHTPPPQLQKKKARLGRTPLFTYKTLFLNLPRAINENAGQAGGTHASPRVHLRRGHPRQFAPNKWTWVQPHVVGHGPGIVHKDYSATYAA